MRETRTYGLKRQEKENGDRRTARCVKDTHTQPSSAVLFRLTAPSLDPTVGLVCRVILRTQLNTRLLEMMLCKEPMKRT